MFSFGNENNSSDFTNIAFTRYKKSYNDMKIPIFPIDLY